MTPEIQTMLEPFGSMQLLRPGKLVVVFGPRAETEPIRKEIGYRQDAVTRWVAEERRPDDEFVKEHLDAAKRLAKHGDAALFFFDIPESARAALLSRGRYCLDCLRYGGLVRDIADVAILAYPGGMALTAYDCYWESVTF